MRNKLVAIALMFIAGGAISASGEFFTNPPTQQSVEPRQVADGRGVKSIDPLPGWGRELISAAEVTRATSRKLLPPATKSLLSVPSPLRHGDYVWNEEGVPAGKLTIWVDLRRQMISAFRNGHEIGTAVIVYGATDMSSPEGTFPVLRKISDYHSRTYDAPMPYSLFITNDGVALHGSPMSKRRASHGCIGLPVDFAQKLFKASRVGDIVEITRSDDSISTSEMSAST